MALNIRTNLPSIAAQRNLAQSTSRLQTAYERLSSGLRINRASDDAAGLAIAETLKADARIATVAIRNANDGISIIAITDGAIAQITNIMSRLAELASQSANGVYSNGQRSALQLEFSALLSEVERIAITTEFNGLKLLSGGGQVVFQGGSVRGNINPQGQSANDNRIQFGQVFHQFTAKIFSVGGGFPGSYHGYPAFIFKGDVSFGKQKCGSVLAIGKPVGVIRFSIEQHADIRFFAERQFFFCKGKISLFSNFRNPFLFKSCACTYFTFRKFE